MELPTQLFDKRARLPRRHSDEAAGLDLHCLEAFYLNPVTPTRVRTGIGIALPQDFAGEVRSHSSLTTRGVIALHSIIDADYRGEIYVVLYRLSNDQLARKTPNPLCQFQAGDRIAQFVVGPVAPITCVRVETLPSTKHGA